MHAKGVETLVQAVARARTPDLRLTIVGDGPDRPAVEALARRLGVSDRMRITGFVSHDRIPGILASADVLVLPSLYEELGTVLLEAMQVGLPAIGSRVGGIPEAIEHEVTGLLVPPGDAVPLAAAIDRVLCDRELAKRLGANARSRAGRYDVDAVAQQVHALYAQLVSARDEAPPSDPDPQSCRSTHAGVLPSAALRISSTRSAI